MLMASLQSVGVWHLLSLTALISPEVRTPAASAYRRHIGTVPNTIWFNMINSCIDGWNLSIPQGSGIATYGHTLLRAIQHLGLNGQVLYGPAAKKQASDIVNESMLIDGRERARRPAGFARSVSTLWSRFGCNAYPILPSGNVIWPTQGMQRPVASSYWASQDLFNLANRAFQNYGTITPIRFNSDSGTERPDVMHWTCPLPLHAPQAANILTIHDVIPLKLPHTTAERKDKYYRLVKLACDRADHIASVSQTTKADLVEFLGIPDQKITVTYQPILPPEAGDREADAIWLKDALGLDWESYFLFYGAVEPKKNLGRLVEAFLDARTNARLVIVGGRSWLSEHETGLLEAALANGCASRILKLDYLPRSSLERLLRGARGTFFPSLYEGFGLPVLESMAMGSPVLTSRGGAVEEVAGEAAVLVDPYDVADIRGGIERLSEDSDLRQVLREQGAARAAVFSVEAYEHRLQAIYRALHLL